MINESSWIARLRGCEALTTAAIMLAEGLCTLSRARNAGVFLLSADGERLIPAAVWPEGQNTPLTEQEAIPAIIDGDSLSFALQTGKAWCGTMKPGFFVSPSIRAIFANSRVLRGIAAMPLLALGDRCIGGVLLGFSHKPPSPESLPLAVRDFGAVMLDALLARERDTSLLGSLHGDLQRMEKEKYAENIVAQEIIGGSAAMQQVRERIAQVALHNVPVLITGETGTGKELAASAIHAASPRRDGPFIKVNCGALPAQLMESELFGHKKGAFTGADRDQPGLFRSANGGTLLLDEIGEMPAELQVKLLHVLQDKAVRPVGEVSSFPVDVRILAATNRDMDAALASGAFRRDVYHRLAVAHIHMPSLREHKEDIPELIRYFLREQESAVKRVFMQPKVVASLLAGSYPGNVRELGARVSRVCISPYVTKNPAGLPVKQFFLQEAMHAYETAVIEATIHEWKGNISDAAKALGLPRTTLRSKMSKRDISAAR